MLRTCKHFIIFLIIYINAKLKLYNKTSEDVLFLIGTPIHGNLGDQAIAYSERLFLDRTSSRTIIEIPSPYALEFIGPWHHLIGSSEILVHGGGFMGSLWPKEDALIRAVLKEFVMNTVIILPQTVFFSGANADEEIIEYQALLDNCKNVTLCVREQFSYEVVSKKLKFSRVKLIPDMVTYLTPQDLAITPLSQKVNTTKQLALLCLRKDKEKSKDMRLLDLAKNKLKAYRIRYTDTVISRKVYPWARKKLISKKIREFQDANIIITDRLHGMVFGALSGVPTLVLSNNNYKILGVYKWISNNSYVIFADSSDKLETFFDTKIITRIGSYQNRQLVNKFEELSKLIGG